MADGKHLLPGGLNNAFHMVMQHILRPLITQIAIQRGKPECHLPAIFHGLEYAYDKVEIRDRLIAMHGVQSVPRKVVCPAATYEKNLIGTKPKRKVCFTDLVAR